MAARNVLVKGDPGAYKVKISDFGLSRKTNYYYSSNNRLIPVRWTAPEALIWAKYGFPSDVWSFGVVLYEIFSRGAIPYAGLSNQKVLQKVTNQGHRLTPPREMPPSMGELMLDCMKDDPDERPSFQMLEKRVLEIGHKLASNSAESGSKTLDQERVIYQAPNCMDTTFDTNTIGSVKLDDYEETREFQSQPTYHFTPAASTPDLLQKKQAPTSEISQREYNQILEKNRKLIKKNKKLKKKNQKLLAQLNA